MIVRKVFTFLCMILILLALATVNFLVFCSPTQIEARMSDMILGMFKGDVQVGAMEFNVYNGLTVHDLIIRDGPGGNVLLHIQEARFQHKMTSIATGSPVLESIDLKGALYLRRQNGRSNWADIMPQWFFDPRYRDAKGIWLSVDEIHADVQLFVQDDLVFKDDAIQSFDAKLLIKRRENDSLQHVISGSIANSFWGQWKLSGALEMQRNRYSWMQVENTAFPVDYHVKEKLVRRVQQQWENLKPRGMAAIKGMIRARLQDADSTLDYQLEVLPLGGEMTYYNFPYPVYNLSGKIIVHKDGLKLRNLTGTNGNTQFQIHGQIHGFGRGSGVDLEIDAANIVLDENFYLALNENTRKVYDSCQPSGLIDLKAYLKRERGSREKVPPHFNVLLKDANFTVKYFPYPIRHAKGVIRIRPHHVSIDSIIAMQQGSWIKIWDSEIWADTPGALTCNLKVIGENIPIDEDFMAAFPEAYRDNFARFDPQGRVDVEAFVSRQSDEKDFDFLARVRPSAFQFTYELFPYRLDCTDGLLVFHPGKIELQDLEGTHGDTEVQLSGEILAGRGQDLNVDLDLDFQKLSLDDEFLSAFSNELQESMQKAKVSGVVDLGAHVKYSKPTEGDSRMDYKGQVDFDGNDMKFGLNFKDVTGTLEFTGQRTEFGDFILAGTSKLNHLIVWDKVFDDLRMKFDYYSGGLLEVREILGRNYGGKMKGNVTFDLVGKNDKTSTSSFEGEFGFQSLNMSLVSKELHKKNPEGRISSHVKFKGDTASAASITGDGFVIMDDVDLWSVPFFSQLFNILTLNDANDTSFKNADLFFHIQDRHVFFDEMDFNSNSIDFVGGGDMDFEGNLDLNLRLAVEPKVLGILPPLGEISNIIINGVLRAVVSADVTGTIKKPKVVVKPLPVLTDILRSMFGGNSRERRLREIKEQEEKEKGEREKGKGTDESQ